MAEFSADFKKLEPDYQQVTVDEIEIIDDPGVRVSLPCGEHALLKLNNIVIYQYVILQVTHGYAVKVDPDMQGFIYVMNGEVSVGGVTVKQAEPCFVEKHDRVEVKATRDSRLMLCFGVPHNQPINQHGSFVD